jgi:hypothetical protein
LTSRKVRVWLPLSLLVVTLLVFGHPYAVLPTVQTGLSEGADSKGGQQAPTAAPSWGSDGNTPGLANAVDWSRFAYTQYVTNSQDRLDSRQ